MRVKDETINERKIEATFDEYDIRTILSEKLAKEQGFAIDPRKTLIGVRFNQVDKGSQGFKHEVTVTMRNLLGEKDETGPTK